MMKSHKSRLAIGLALTATMGAGLITGSANADPKQYSAFVGVGSDTTQDVLNALSGESSGILYTPVKASTGEQIISFNALGPGEATGTCIIAKVGGPSFDRPNGSGNGHEALSRSLDQRAQTAAVGPKWGSNVCTGGTVAAPNRTDVSGQIDFGRSSSLPTVAGSDISVVAMARDALSFAYYRNSGGAAVTSLTRAQLTSLFSTGPQPIDPDGAGPLAAVNIIPCGIQTGAGTFASWNTTVNVTAAQELTATATCNALIPADGAGTGRAQEHDAVDLRDRGVVAPAGSQVIIGFSASQFVARSNGRADPLPPAGVGMGSISDNGAGVNLGSPVTGTAPNVAPVASFYNDTTFGRTVYNLIPELVFNAAIPNAMQSLFKGATSSVCAATSTIQAMGFLVAPNCGTQVATTGLRDGTLN
jgi:hypothetical protein